MSKRVASILICLIFVLTSILAGCGGTKQSEQTSSTVENSAKDGSSKTEQSTSPEQSSAGYTLPLSTNGDTLVIGTYENNADKTMASGLPVFNEIEKKTGVKIKWECTPTADYDKVMQTRLAAGTNLPDIIKVPGDPVKYVNDGLLLEIGSFITKTAPNISKWFEKEPYAKKCMTAPDGKIYTLPGTIVENNGGANDMYNIPANVVRADWMEKLGLKEPTTLNEFHDVLKAFKERDPNGNGKPDEIPYSFFGGANIIRFLGWSYGLHLAFSGGIYPDKDGKLVYEWITPQMKDLLTLANQWYKEGLLDKGFTPVNTEKWNSQILNDLVGSVPISNVYPEYVWNKPLRDKTKNPKAGFVAIPPLKGPSGIIMSEASMTSASDGYFAVTKSCKNPELAVKWLDYACYSDDGVLYNEFGVENDSYVMKDGKAVFTDKILKAKDGITTEMWREGSYHYSVPQVLTKYGRYIAFEPNKALFPKAEELYNIAKSTPPMPNILATKDEADKLALIMGDISTYLSEMIDKFITGDEPISNFDKFVRKIKDMKIDEVMKIKQDQYDRFSKKN